ncbi:ATP synthase F0 subunit B [Streptomyces sp. UNOB3_S3]|uniref:ATP synthase F0 subunit B n=1 Tax=Streptomyces sp. UNOB3_S3 TaxID=2871682 RepID=UPI001E5C30CC|nr:ATP synthase F0 subunit B [Streptomyces sp. UNOB3_S3]MCC3774397.1 ATP synthase F0 subunit B [Streptomyces sp. UNOB3_S3]
MDVQQKLDEIVSTVAGARALPMSASCVVNRAELLALLDEVRAALPGSLDRAREVIGDREQLVARAHEEAEAILASARAQRGSLISDTEVARQSREEADRILAEAHREAEEIRAGADDYVDSTLANFEVVLTKTIGSVDRGREKLLGLGADGHDPEGLAHDAPERSTDPRTQRQGADAYVDVKLGAVSAVLAKALEAVGRGREKLLGARPVDELGAHLAAHDGITPGRPTSDADFLAELAGGPQEPLGAPRMSRETHRAPEVPQAPQVPQQPVWSDYTVPAGGYDAQDPYGYHQQPAQYPPQADPYAVSGGYQQPDPYAWQSPAQGTDGHGTDLGHGYGTAAGYPADGHQPRAAGALDETSFFDTSMIDLNRLRQYEQGR